MPFSKKKFIFIFWFYVLIWFPSSWSCGRKNKKVMWKKGCSPFRILTINFLFCLHESLLLLPTQPRDNPPTICLSFFFIQKKKRHDWLKKRFELEQPVAENKESEHEVVPKYLNCKLCSLPLLLHLEQNGDISMSCFSDEMAEETVTGTYSSFFLATFFSFSAIFTK